MLACFSLLHGWAKLPNYLTFSQAKDNRGSESVKCRFTTCRFSAELEKLEKYSRWGAALNNKSKKPWAFCRRAGIDAALVRVQLALRGCTHHWKTELNLKIQNTKVASVKVAFDTVRVVGWTRLVPQWNEIVGCRFAPPSCWWNSCVFVLYDLLAAD